jgi:hypothetical protein
MAIQTITLAMKSSMKVSLFQWSQVSINPEWKAMINSWFRRFKVNINLNNFFYVNSIILLILLKLFFYKFKLQEIFLLG